jgi:hypothetical protein
MGADGGGRPSFAGTGHAQIGVTRNHSDYLLVDLFQPSCQFFCARAHGQRFLPRTNGVMS